MIYVLVKVVCCYICEFALTCIIKIVAYDVTTPYFDVAES